jgi:predicted PurR-regulated permease PerM
MKAALAARSASETEAQLTKLQQQASIQANASGQSIASETEVLILNGFMLDAAVTAVFFVLICLFLYFMVGKIWSRIRPIDYLLFLTVN